MQSRINEHVAHAMHAERVRRPARAGARVQPPPGRVRFRAALALIALAGRLDREQARGAQAPRRADAT